MTTSRIITGDALESLKELPDGSVNCCVTSPPYWGLRDYGTATWDGGDPDCDHRQPIGGTRNKGRDRAASGGTFHDSPKIEPALGLPYRDVCGKCGALRIDDQIGLEETPEAYVARLVEVFREVRRVLRDDGTLWLILGDSYAAGKQGRDDAHDMKCRKWGNDYDPGKGVARKAPAGLKPKDLVGIPWRVAFALQADGWYLRQDIIWCLSGGTWLYVRSQKGDMPMMVKDVARLDPSTVQLWNGERWTRLKGTSRSPRTGDEIEIVLRSGERIACTPGHRFPTKRGVLDARDIKVGDLLETCRLPEPEMARDCAIGTDAAWFAGLYLAEGSRSGECIQIAGHAKEVERWNKVQRIAWKYGGSATRTVNGNCQNIRVYGKIPNAIIDEFVSGRTAKDKGFAPVVWRYSDAFVAAMLDGYLSGDGHRDNARWRLGFCRNYNLERDLRTACARLGYRLTLNLSHTPYNGADVPTFRGEIRTDPTDYRTVKPREEVVEIRKARCRFVYDLGVEDEPHLFALASGVLTHNSKPNPMPESVRDRCTKAHEYLFLLSKSPRYYYDADAIKEPAVCGDNGSRYDTGKTADHQLGRAQKGRRAIKFGGTKYPGVAGNATYSGNEYHPTGYRNKRDVWTVSTRSYKEAHFATFPPDLIRPCIKAGCPIGGVVLDPFAGAGTTGLVALEEGRDFLGIELNPEYVGLIETRLAPLLAVRTLDTFDEGAEA